MDSLAERLARLSPEQLALLMQRARATEPAPRAAIPRRTGAGPWPLSFAQQRLWFVQQLDPESAAYNESGVVRLEGDLDAAALRGALDGVVERHEALRTVLVLRDGEPAQEVVAGMRVPLETEDVSSLDPAAWDGEIQRRARAEQARPLDLAAGPLLRATLLRLSPRRHALILVMHHVISDGWSRGIIVREISALYTALADGTGPRLPDLPVQYPDYAVWQRERLQGAVLAEQLQYWKEALAGAPPALPLPADHPRPPVQSFAGGVHRFPLPREAGDALGALARAEGATPFMALLAAFKTLLLRYAGTGDVVVGTPVANRGRSETEGLVGFFANMLALRTDLSGDPPFREALRRVRDAALGAYAHEELPFERLVEELHTERSLSRNEVFQVVFLLDESPLKPFRLPGVEMVPVEIDSGTSIFDLTLRVETADDGLAGRLEYATALFDAATIERMAAHFAVLLEGIAADPDARLSALPLMPAGERALLARWMDTDRRYPPAFAHGLFAAQAARTPDAPALVHGGETLSYGALEARANRLANHLVRLGVGPEVRVGVSLERTPELIVALLAVLKAGGAYVPLDPAYPRERLGYMMEDAGVRRVLTSRALADGLPPSADPLPLDALREQVHGESAEAPRIPLLPDNLSHVIFTSGSTGRPKGVMIRHASTAVLLHWMREIVTDEERASVLGSTSINFDVSVAEIFGTLCWGGTLVLVENALELPSVAHRQIRYASMVPTAAAELLRAGGIPASVRTLNLGGEPLPNDLAQALYGLENVVKVGNLYGPTEDTTYSTYSRVAKGADRVLVGAPVANTRAYVLDERLRPAAVGVVGELYLAGDGLSRGYAARPGLTAERFVPDPFGAPGARMYRVMDRIRWTAGGELEYFGRTDFQVKVRGFRIELGEIETALRAHASLRDAVALVREDAPGDRRIVAYAVPAEGGEAPSAAALRAHLKERLPEYMVPSAFVPLDALPRTPNGKVDRAALPAPDAPSEADGTTAPRTPAEELLAGIFAEVLGVERAGVHDDFFVLGGHSLLAMRAVTRVRDAFGVELSVRALFEAPTVAELAARVEVLRADAAPAAGPPLVPVPRDRPLPLSFAQQRLWFIQQLDPRTVAYNTVGVTRMAGALDVAALRSALDTVVERHEALRTVMTLGDGEPVQQVVPGMRVPLEMEDLSAVDPAEWETEVERRARREQELPFDLAAGPLLRATLLRLSPERHKLVLVMHHVISDGWSRGIIVREISAAYTALVNGQPPSLPPLPVQYPDYAVWQRRRLQGELLDAQLAYWRGRLAGAPAALALPTDHPRPALQSFAGRVHRFRLPDGIADPLRALAREEGATLFMVLMAAFKTLLARYTGTADLVVGTPVANRGRGETEGLVGFFANMLALRTDLSGDPPFREALRRVRDVALGGYAHEELPFERLVEALQPERSLSRNEIFQVVFLLDETPVRPFRLPGVELSPVEVETGTSVFDLSLRMERDEDGLGGSLEYATALFDAPTVERMAAHFTVLLQGIALNPDARLDDLPLLAEGEAALLAAWGEGAPGPRPAPPVHRAFEAHARRAPDAVAVAREGDRLTYGELDARAERLARRLVRAGVGRETRVAVLLERGPELVTALLAVLKAGGAYVPIDPAYPAERVAYMRDDSGAAVLLTVRALAGHAGPAVSALCLDEGDGEEGTDPLPEAMDGEADALAYVVYTSGSTGRPKGVAVPHGGIARLAAWQAAAYGVASGDRCTLVASPAFDASAWEVWGALAAGAALHVVPDALRADPGALLGWMGTQGIDLSFLPTPAAEGVLEALERGAPRPPRLRALFAGGDALRRRPPAGLRLVNLYGPTENSVVSTAADVAAEGAGTPSIGRPVDGHRARVLDARLRPAPVGVAGELYVAGEGLARGYLGRPALTAERFLPDPFGRAGARMYRTGDRARWRAPGELEFAGRADGQLKVRGFRIEPGEVEAALAAHPAVGAAVAVAWDDGTGERRLVAYAAPAGGAEVPPAAALRRWLGERLPAHMVPSLFVALEELPLTSSGKVDRRALPRPDGAQAAPAAGYVAPRNEVEATISGVWREVLGVERVGIRDSFFELGGTSVRLASVHRLLGERLGKEVTIVDLFRYPTVAGLAEFLAGDGAAAAPAEARGQVQERADRQRQAQEARQQRHRQRRG